MNIENGGSSVAAVQVGQRRVEGIEANGVLISSLSGLVQEISNLLRASETGDKGKGCTVFLFSLSYLTPKGDSPIEPGATETYNEANV